MAEPVIYHTGKACRSRVSSDLLREDQQHPSQPHMAVCRYTNAEELRVVIAENKDNINRGVGNWGSPLRIAVRCDFVEAVEVLLEAGADDSVDRNFQRFDSVWILAAKLGRREILRRVWSRIAEPPDPLQAELDRENIQFDEDSKAACLREAAGHGQAATVRDMLDWKQDWHIRSLSEAVVAAAYEWQDEVVALLLGLVTFPTERLNVFLRAACSLKPVRAARPRIEDYLGFDGVRQEQQVAGIIRAGAEVDVPRARGRCDLVRSTASVAFLIGALKGLLDNGANPNQADSVHGLTALHGLAWPVGPGEMQPYAYRHNYSAARLLLEHGADVFRPDDRGNTPLHYAAAGADMHLLSMYASAAGLGVTEMVAGRRNHVGETVLHWAAVGGKADILEYLLSRPSQDDTEKDDRDLGISSNLNVPNDYGWTPLMCAAIGDGHYTRSATDAVRAVEVLLDHGADANITTADGLNVLHALSTHLDTDPDSALGRVTERLLRSMSRSEADKKMQERAKPHADISKRWQVPYPFHGDGCSKRGCWSPQKDHWTRHLDEDDGDEAAGTPLHWAARYGGLGVARAVLAAGADYLAKDQGGDMCIQLAYKARGELPDEAVHGFMRLVREQQQQAMERGRGITEETPGEA
ncbi:ankyrin repeat-containing domain protein, partial [Plectosphaerella plurivora]